MESRKAWTTSDSPTSSKEVPTWVTNGEIWKWPGPFKPSTRTKAILWEINSKWKCRIQPWPKNTTKAYLKASTSCPRILPRLSLTIVLWTVPTKISRQLEVGMETSFRANHTTSCKAWIKELTSKILREPTIKMVTSEFELTKRDQWQPRMPWISWSIKTSPLLSIRSITRPRFRGLSNWTQQRSVTPPEVRILMSAPKTTWLLQWQPVVPSLGRLTVKICSPAIVTYTTQHIKSLRYSVIKLQSKAARPETVFSKGPALKLRRRWIIWLQRAAWKIKNFTRPLRTL